MARCPGQDQRFWKLDDIFEVNCPQCGYSIEFWKDEPQVKCPKCKQVITNPKLDLGCAKWCKRAKECLGQLAGAQSNIMCNKLIEELRELAGDSHEVIASSLDVLSYATNIQAQEGGDPLVVKAAAILSGINSLPVCQDAQDDTGDSQNPLTRKILIKHGIDSEQINNICKVINACHQKNETDSVEFRIVYDAHLLSRLNRLAKSDSATITKDWKTTTAQKLADDLFQP
ncbi:MAG: hypothetical protein KAS23_06605 [Anaerohalosphaera sp.]|nr:hypothetical protein [Anaerohalosphaera sp.]